MSRAHPLPPVPPFRPLLEALEDRWLPAVITWTNSLGGSWNNAANWDAHRLPGANDDVVINLAVGGVYYSSWKSTTVRSITCKQTLTVSGGTLAVLNNSTIDTLKLSGGTMSTAKVLDVSALSWSDGKLAGAGQVNVWTDADLWSNKSKTIDRVRLNTYGTTDWTNGWVRSTNGGSMVNQDGAVFTATGGYRLDPNFENIGTVRFDAAGTVTFASFANSGEVILEGGTLRVGGYTQSAGMTQLAGGTLASESAVVLDGGTLSGSGTVDASVLNRGGLVEPGGGQTLHVAGDYTQLAGGKLAISILATPALNSLSLLSVAGTASLAGTLLVQVNGTPAVNGVYDLVVASATTGQFTAVQTAALPGWNLSVQYAADGVDLVTQLAPPIPRLPTGPTLSPRNPTYPNPAKVSAESAETPTTTTTTPQTVGATPASVEGTDTVRFLLTQTSGGGGANAVNRPGEVLTSTPESLALGYSRGNKTVTLSSSEGSSGGREEVDLADELFGAFALAPPEVELPSEAELLATADALALLPVGRARADILPQGRGQLSVVATVLSGGETAEGQVTGAAAPLSELLLDPLGAGGLTGWSAAAPGDATAAVDTADPAEDNGRRVPRVLLATAGFLGVVTVAVVGREKRAKKATRVGLPAGAARA